MSRLGSTLQYQIDTHPDVIAARQAYRAAKERAFKARIGRKTRANIKHQEALHDLIRIELEVSKGMRNPDLKNGET